MKPELVVDDVRHSMSGSQVSLRVGEQCAELLLDAVGQVVVDVAVARVAESLELGTTLGDAVATVANALSDMPGHTARARLHQGAWLLDDTAARTALDVRASLRVLADLSRGSTRSFAVLGELECAPADWFDDHDALGRIVVRLDVSQLIVVGDGARHLHNAAGLEGSWDGESLLVGTVEQAYDVLRGQIGEGDVILVSAASHAPLDLLVRRLMDAGR
jgi:UDP-N-acetylmuramyl pentapeptide synthase